MKTLTPADNLNDDSALTLFSINRKSSIKRLGLILFPALSIVAAVVVWLRTESYRPVAESRIAETEYNLNDEPLQPLPPTIKLDEKKVSLGEKLFNDPQLSRTNAVSCSSCHSLSTGGTDQSDHSTGVERRRTDFKEGYRLFKSYGCASCHQGVGVGRNMFQRFGVMGDYFADRGNPSKADLDRFNVTGNEADRHLFKVPGLRNVALTALYFHDGSASSLEEAVSVMAKYQLGRHLSSEELHRIVSFLKTLSGEYKGKAL